MPTRLLWEPAFESGHPAIDAQHQALLAQCTLLADHCAGAGQEAAEQAFDAARDHAFDRAFDALKQQARVHFETEAALLAAGGCSADEVEDYRHESAEFEYLAADIATTANFHRLELQRFVALWCLGHVKASAQQLQRSSGC